MPDEDMVAIIDRLGAEWRRIAEASCSKEQLTDYEQFCVAFSAGCPVRLTPSSTASSMEWESAPHILERDEDGWRVFWRQFDA